MSAQRSHLSIGQSGITAVGVAAMSEAGERDCIGYASRATDPAHLSLDVAHCVSAASCPGQMDFLFRVWRIPHDNQRSRSRRQFQPRDHLRPQRCSVRIEEWNGDLLGLSVFVMPNQNMVGIVGGTIIRPGEALKDVLFAGQPPVGDHGRSAQRTRPVSIGRCHKRVQFLQRPSPFASVTLL